MKWTDSLKKSFKKQMQGDRKKKTLDIDLLKALSI